MIKVLHKSLAVLEYIASRKDPITATEVTKALRLTHPTCIRILKELTELGYLEQSGFRKGYHLGPIPFQLTGGQIYCQPFMEKAEEEIRDCARQLGQSILLSTRHGSWRTLQYSSNYNPDFCFRNDHRRLYDLYWTSSGRLLLAYATPRELEVYLEENGLPVTDRKSKQYWPETAGSVDRLHEKLNEIRTNGFVELEVSNCGNYHCLALPVFWNRTFFGALAANWPVNSSETFNRECREAIFELADRISYREIRKVIVG